MHLHKPHDQRPILALINLLLMLAFALLMQSCTTFEKAFRKYATTRTDTTYTTITSVVPRDSAVLRIVTDTTTVVHEIRQGRARIIYQRTPKETLIQAACDSVVIEKRVPVYVTKQVWGVDPKYKNQMQSWRASTIVLGGIMLVLLVLYTLIHQLKISISKR